MGLGPRETIAKELRRDGLSHDLAESFAKGILESLRVAGYQIVPDSYTQIGNQLSDAARGVALSIERLEVNLSKLDEAIELWESR